MQCAGFLFIPAAFWPAHGIPAGHAVDLLKLPVKECPVAAADLFHDLADGAFGVRQQKRRLRELLAVLQFHKRTACNVLELGTEIVRVIAELFCQLCKGTGLIVLFQILQHRYKDLIAVGYGPLCL